MKRFEQVHPGILDPEEDPASFGRTGRANRGQEQPGRDQRRQR